MNKTVTLVTLLTCFLTTRLFSQPAYQVLREAQYNEPVLQSGALKSYKTFVLDASVLKRLVGDAPESLTLSIPAPGNGHFEAALQKREIFDPGFRVTTPDGVSQGLDLGIHYAGKLAGDPKSVTAFSFYRDCMFGMVATDAGNFNIVFLRDENKNPSQRYVVYNDRDLTVPNLFHCGTDELPAVPRTDAADKADDGGERSATCKTIRQYYECDNRMFLDNGGSVQNTISWTTGMFNVVGTLYHNEQVSIRLSEVFVWSTGDPYPSATAGEALTAFGNARQDNFNGDLAQLLSTKNAGNGGLAWLDVLCQNYWAEYAYGRFSYSNINNAYANLPLWSWTINCVTHETGHNLGSNHTHWCGWELSPGHFGAIDSCYVTEEDNGVQCYGGPAKPIRGTIMSYCHLGLGTDLNLGFGPLPGNRIRERVQQASCIATGTAVPTPVVTGSRQYCVGDNIQLTATYSGGTFSWTGPNGFSSSSTAIGIPGAVTANAGVYVASVTTPQCVISEYVNVQVSTKPPTPNISVSGNTLKCLPSSTSYTYQWYTENGTPVGDGISTFNPGVSGKYYVVVSRNGCASDQSVLTNFNYTAFASVSENEAGAGISVFPNPASGQVFLQLPGSGRYDLAVYDLSGRLVARQNVTADQSPVRIDVSSMSDGMYVAEVTFEGKKERAKFLVKN